VEEDGERRHLLERLSPGVEHAARPPSRRGGRSRAPERGSSTHSSGVLARVAIAAASEDLPVPGCPISRRPDGGKVPSLVEIGVGERTGVGHHLPPGPGRGHQSAPASPRDPGRGARRGEGGVCAGRLVHRL
jgi:hypothetical protein